ncbi:GNAT family N-acetyltransferase [Streptomyces dioscori]|uniref:GNAT family N-acetyltransferase n=1 Tax=Streptomyces dioscori TaxID=2109333 RepID=UPI001CEC7561|nr:GNAT family N-acetyltransferase [Streptomyces dioscori]
MAEVYLRRLSRWQAEQQRDAVADVYVSAYRGAAGAEHRDRQGFLRRLEQHVQHTGFDMVVADTAGTVGCAYGFRAPRTGEWWSDFQGELPTDIEELTASGRTFLLAELMVLPAHRRRGVATRLVERLLIRLDADLVVAATGRDADSPAGGRGNGAGGGGGSPGAAAEAFRAWGWSRFGVLGPRITPATAFGAGPGPDRMAGEVWIRRPLR